MMENFLISIRAILVAALMRIVWKLGVSPSEFATRCREIVEQHEGQERHRLFDEASNDLLRSLGYGEGVDMFVAHASGLHLPSQRWLDRMIADQPEDACFEARS